MRIITLFSILAFFIFSATANDGYWQQKVDFNISVSLTDSTKFLDGSVQMHYTNNSPDTLHSIYLHLWPNAYSKYNSAFARQLLKNGSLVMDQMGREDLGAIGKMDFTIDDERAEFKLDAVNPDIGILKLNQPLLPGGQIDIHTPFRVKVPKILSRLGYKDDFFSITQWYPKPAVYDKDGWQAMPYLDQGEFFSEFGKYTVAINVPDQYEVAATGNRTHAVSENGRKTFIYEQDNIHDFAWFASPDFKYISEKVEMANGNNVIVQTYYTTEDGHWDKVNDMAKNALQFYSDKIGPYPYSFLTLVEGPLLSGSGMEYPTITIVKNTTNIQWLEVVVAHEVGHNWWYAVMANNERENPWIDEGFNSYYEERYNDEAAINPFHPEKRITELKVARMLDIDHLTMDDFSQMRILQQERLNRHQALSIHPEKTTSKNYYQNHYSRMPIYVEHLASYLGVENFDACMKSFYEKFTFRHIYPEDLQQHFENCSGKDLSFLFQDRIETSRIVDSKIKKVTEDEDGTIVKIARKGIAVPLTLTAVNDKEEETIWLEASENDVTLSLTGIKNIYLDEDNLTLDHNRNNNYWKSKGFKKIEKITPFFLGSVENPKKSQLFFMPVVAGNTHDKFMLGLSLYNRVYPAKNIDWNVTPLYAFGSKQLNGITNFSYYQNIHRERHVQLGYHMHFKTFTATNSSSGGRYINFSPSMTATILPPDRSKNIKHILEVKHHQNWMVRKLFDENGPISEGYIGQALGELRYTIVREDVKTPISASAYAFNNKDILKVGTELNFKIRYGKIKSYVHGRFFLEGFVYKKTEFATSSNGYPRYQSGLGGTPGSSDYLFEQYYLGRNQSTGIVSRQIQMDRGQFKTASPSLLRANAMATSVNIRADFPSKWIPIQLYMDFGVAMNEPASGVFAFQMGGVLSLFNQGIEIYFPFFSSSQIRDFYDLNIPKYKQRITFSFDIDKLNPHKRAREYVL